MPSKNPKTTTYIVINNKITGIKINKKKAKQKTKKNRTI